MNTLDKDNILRDKIAEITAAEGIDIVEYRLFLSNGIKVVRCVVDYRQGGITIDACARINKKVVSFLNESRLLGGDFSVEINSPGLDRPLNSPRDFLRVKGKTVCLWLNEQVEKSGYLEGELTEVSDDDLTIIHKGSPLKIKFCSIKTGKERISI
ncbi:MAG: hypothetical protein JW867_00530 [Candidatus Omnitrophica bacterium]|nr:hypothetical protein [Candidatus Omnitrophota bacterium]